MALDKSELKTDIETALSNESYKGKDEDILTFTTAMANAIITYVSTGSVTVNHEESIIFMPGSIKGNASGKGTGSMVISSVGSFPSDLKLDLEKIREDTVDLKSAEDLSLAITDILHDTSDVIVSAIISFLESGVVTSTAKTMDIDDIDPEGAVEGPYTTGISIGIGSISGMDRASAVTNLQAALKQVRDKGLGVSEVATKWSDVIDTLLKSGTVKVSSSGSAGYAGQIPGSPPVPVTGIGAGTDMEGSIS